MIVVKLDDDQTTIRSGNVEIDLTKHVVSIKGKNIILTEEEYDIAVLMARWGLL